MRSLMEKCNQLYEYHRGGWFNQNSYHLPAVPEELADEVDDWYVIIMPDSIWVLRSSDVPNGYFAYRDVADKVLVRIVRKTREEYEKEEERERQKRLG